MEQSQGRQGGTDPRNIHFSDPKGRNYHGKIFLIAKRESGKMRLNSPENRMNRLVPVHTVDERARYQMNHFGFWMRKSVQEILRRRNTPADLGGMIFVSKWISALEQWIENVESCGISNALNDCDQNSDYSNLYRVEFEFDSRGVANFKAVVVEMFESTFGKPSVRSLERNVLEEVENFGKPPKVEEKKSLTATMASEDAEMKELMDTLLEEAGHLKEIEQEADQFVHKKIMGEENIIFHCSVSRSKSNEHNIQIALQLANTCTLYTWMDFFISIFWDIPIDESSPRFKRLKSKSVAPKYQQK